MRRQSKKLKISTVIIYLFLLLLVVVYVLPLLWVFMVSLKTNSELNLSPFRIPETFQWENYKTAWTTAKLGVATINSAIVCTITLIVSLIVGALAAFAIGRLRWKLSSWMLIYFMLGMMIPIHCVLIPLFTTFADLNLTNSLFGLIIPYVTFSLPITIFILTGFFKGMPNELFESACIDGCSIYACFLKIALPLAKTGLFVTGLMSFVSNWNELLFAMVFISDVKKKTLPVTLTYFVSPYSTDYVQMFAAIIVAVLPTILVYCTFSNQIVDGLTQGAVKG